MKTLHCISTELRKKKTLQCKLETYQRKQRQTSDLWPDYDIITDAIFRIMTS